MLAMMSQVEFQEWLRVEMSRRDWKYAELAERAKRMLTRINSDIHLPSII